MNQAISILVIDDDDVTNFLTKMTLENWEHTGKVEVKRNATDALAFLKDPESFKPDVIFLDINLAIYTGWEFLKLAKEADVKCLTSAKIFMFSASIMPVDKKKANDHPLVDDFLKKPISVEMLDLINKKFKLVL